MAIQVRLRLIVFLLIMLVTVLTIRMHTIPGTPTQEPKHTHGTAVGLAGATSLVHSIDVKAGDSIFLPAGRFHGIFANASWKWRSLGAE